MKKIIDEYLLNWINNQLCVFVSTVSEMESQYTKREIAEARTARDFQRRLASPPNTKMIRALNEGTIQNTTVTAEHVR